MLPGPEPAKRQVVWARAFRIIPSRFPPIPLFERVDRDPAVWDALIAAEMLVNPRIRDAVGEIALVPPEERLGGPGASYVMASFTHVNPKGSRFGDGSFGVYYAAIDFRTALKETVFHFERFARDSGDGLRHEDMRVLAGSVDAAFHDIASLDEPERTAVLDPDSYRASRAFGARLRAGGSNGVIYPSVRHAGGVCIGAFRPKAVRPPVQTEHIRYRFDGERVTDWFSYESETWHRI